MALNFKARYVAPPSVPVVTPPLPSLCGLFELGSEIDNESYDFYQLLKSELTDNWPLTAKAQAIKASTSQ